MKKILDKVKTKVLEGINLLALKLTARSANLACDWLYFQDEEKRHGNSMHKESFYLIL